jgi:hypothetical protein
MAGCQRPGANGLAWPPMGGHPECQAAGGRPIRVLALSGGQRQGRQQTGRNREASGLAEPDGRGSGCRGQR